MSAEKYQNDEASTAVIEDLFEKLHDRAVKEFGKGWEHRRLAGGIATKALYLYTQPNAEERITEYMHAGEPGYKSEDDMDAEMTYDQRAECHDVEVSFEAERLEDDEQRDITTRYTVSLLSASKIDDVIDLPEQVRKQVAEKVAQAEADHIEKVSNGELGPDEAEDFNGTIAFNKVHKFILEEQQESLDYGVTHSYEVANYSVPMLTYLPEDDPSSPTTANTTTVNAEAVTNESIDDPLQRDDMRAMFDEIMRHQDIEKPVAKRPAELRVAQVMAILAILQHGEAQNEEQEAIIKDLM